MTKQPDFEDIVDKAVELYVGSDGNIEIDANPALSWAVDGVWVQAWVWLSEEDLNDKAA